MKVRSLDTTLLVFGIICIGAILTWIVPAGVFEKNEIEVPGAGTREVVVPGTFEYLETSTPQGPLDVLRAPIRGIVAAADIIAFVLLIGGAFAVLTQTGAIDHGLHKLIGAADRSPMVETALIPVFMVLFGLAGGIFGMAEEALPFVLIFVPMAHKLGYDRIVGFSIVMVGSQIGFAAAFLNPFTVGIAQGIAAVPLFSGIGFRIGMWVVFMLIGIVFVMRYAARVKANPAIAIMPEDRELDSVSRPQDVAVANEAPSSVEARNVGPVLLTFLGSLALLVWGVLERGWYIEEIAALFVGMGILVGVIGRLSAPEISAAFMKGVRDLASTAVVIGLARGILIVMEDGQVIDTLLFGLANTMDGLGGLASAEAMLLVQSALNFFVPSGSGQAALTMPLMSQLADLVDVTRQTAVLAYQLGDGLTNLVVPTNPVLIGALALGGIPWTRWMRWVWPMMLVLMTAAMITVAIAVAVGF